jgi:hypothetical protein
VQADGARILGIGKLWQNWLACRPRNRGKLHHQTVVTLVESDV